MPYQSVGDFPAAAFPNALLLPLKLRFCQAAASAAKLAAATMLPPLPPLAPRGHRHATTAYKKKCNTIDQPFFSMMVTAVSSNNGGATRQQR
jgi:hypothetical protein